MYYIANRNHLLLSSAQGEQQQSNETCTALQRIIDGRMSVGTCSKDSNCTRINCNTSMLQQSFIFNPCSENITLTYEINGMNRTTTTQNETVQINSENHIMLVLVQSENGVIFEVSFYDRLSALINDHPLYLCR